MRSIARNFWPVECCFYNNRKYGIEQVNVTSNFETLEFGHDPTNSIYLLLQLHSS